MDHWSVCMWKQEQYWVIGQVPNNKLYLKKWKNSRCHFSYWYSIVSREVIILLPGTGVRIPYWILSVCDWRLIKYLWKIILHLIQWKLDWKSVVFKFMSVNSIISKYIEVYEGSFTSVKWNSLIAVKFWALSQTRIVNNKIYMCCAKGKVNLSHVVSFSCVLQKSEHKKKSGIFCRVFPV